MVTILNTSILTTHGTYNYIPVTAEEAKNLVKDGFQSAVGHQVTCDILTTILEVDVPLNRIQYQQNTGDKALVFKLNGRPEEGKILTREEVEGIGFSFGLLEKIS